MFIGEFSGNKLDDSGVDLDVGKVCRRDPVLAAQEGRDLLLTDIAELGEIRPDPPP